MDSNKTEDDTDVTGVIHQTTSSLTKIMENTTVRVSSQNTAETVTEPKQTSDRVHTDTASYISKQTTTTITTTEPITDSKETTDIEGTHTVYTDTNTGTYDTTTMGSKGSGSYDTTTTGSKGSGTYDATTTGTYDTTTTGSKSTLPIQNHTRSSHTVTTGTWTRTDRHSTVHHSTGWNQTEATTLTHGEVSSQADCSDKIGIAAGVGAGAVMLVMVLCLVLLVKMKLRWQRKLRDERLKTDIWTMSTLNNTIINENFTDYRLAPALDDRRSKQSSTTSRERNSKTKLLYSISQTASDRSSSSICDGQFPLHDAAAIRRSTLSSPDLRGHLKVNAMRQLSAHSNYDMWINQSSEGGRSRTSTFTGGRKDKIDRHVLLNHDEFQTAHQTHSHIVTEL